MAARRSKFGRDDTNVERYFEEIGAVRDRAVWHHLLEKGDSRKILVALDSVRDAGLSASVDSAIGKASRAAVAKAGVHRNDLPEIEWGPMAFSNLLTMVNLAAIALALGSKLPEEARVTVLSPFAEVGFASVLVGMPDEDG